MSKKSVLGYSILIGALSGLRAFSAVAVVSHAAADKQLKVRDERLRYLAKRGVAITLAVGAAGEIVADKLPSVPDRTAAGPLAARIAFGALCGATLADSARQCAARGAVAGGLAAAGSTFAAYHLRRLATHEWGAPDIAVALLEDALAVGGALAIVSAAI